MKVTPSAILPDVLIIEPARYRDDRGWFMESFQAERYAEHGIRATFAQDSVSWSEAGVLRGLHLQHPGAQGKLVCCLEGEVLDVAVDVRPGSATFGKHITHLLSATNGQQLWIPEGFAHGFVAGRAGALFHYKCTRPYVPAGQVSIRWDDPKLAIDWGIVAPVLSEKDARAPLLEAVLPLLTA